MTQKIFMVFAILVALTMTAFSNYHEKKINNSPVLGCFLAMKEQQPYEINFNLNKINETIFEIEINMTLLDSNAYFGSPQSRDRIQGAFSLDFGDTSHIAVKGPLVELPVATLHRNEFGTGSIYEVHENTTYKQLIELKTNDNFFVAGRVRFVIEPRCTLEEIPFGLEFKNKTLILQKDIGC